MTQAPFQSSPSAPRLTRRLFIGGAAATAISLATTTPVLALDGRGTRNSVGTLGAEHATEWVQTLYDVVMAEGLTPPAAARFYYYCALAMYETAVPGMPGYASMAGQVTDLGKVPKPHGRVDWPIAISTAVSQVARGLLPNATPASLQKLDDRRQGVLQAGALDMSQRDVDRSVEHGQQVAKHLLEWIAADGYSVASTLPYVPPTGPGLWRSTPPNFGRAIEPHWSLVRPAVLRTADEVEPAMPITFSSEPGSPFYEQAMVTYLQSSANTQEQINIARFWTDNPLLSGLPSGHWFLLLGQLAQDPLRLQLDRTLEAFVLLGVALHDAFTNCWTWKYRYNLIRPVSYIQDHIDPAWRTLVNTPQFAEYTSGHSVGSGAAEVILTSLFGEFAFEDSTGLNRGLASRSFTSFNHAAEEAAISRLYGGIHYPMGIENGVAQGREVGRLVDDRIRTSPARLRR